MIERRNKMDFINTIKERARKDIKKIVLPEASDVRILRAAEIALSEAYAEVVLVGNEDSIKAMAGENNIDVSKAIIVDPLKSEKAAEYAEKLYDLRKEKGLTQQEVADNLNVSNKTISKWERDEGYPEITMLPEIAKYYGITTDELLNGERFVKDTEICYKKDRLLETSKTTAIITDTVSVFSFFLFFVFHISLLRLLPYVLETIV